MKLLYLVLSFKYIFHVFLKINVFICIPFQMANIGATLYLHFLSNLLLYTFCYELYDLYKNNFSILIVINVGNYYQHTNIL